jgi:uncharacterized membrane protein YeaQ/YmgE (transglycosylase-associated protein family)
MMDVATMSWLSWIVVGGIAGWAANTLVKSRQGLPTNTIIGIVGAFTGGYLFSLIGRPGSGFNIVSVAGAFIGALVLLSIGRLLVGTSRAAY